MRVRGLAVLLVLAACGRDPPPVPAPAPEPRAASTPAAVPVAPTPSVMASTPAPAATPVIERSRVPTTAEWKAASKLALDGAEWTGCTAEGVREWVRVSCRGVGRAGTPVSVLVTRGKGADVITYMKDGVTSVLFRFVPGTEVDALFAWNEEEGDNPILPLAVRWPRETPTAPNPIGAFAGVPTSLSPKRREAECACFWQMKETRENVTRPSTSDVCKGTPAHTFRFACLRTERGDDPTCVNLLGCTQLPSPNVYVECLPGEIHVYASPSAYCARACSSDKPCPPGFQCAEGAGHDGESACSFDKAP